MDVPGDHCARGLSLPARTRSARRRLRGRRRAVDRLPAAVLAGGTRWVEDRLRILPVRWMGAGLLLSALTGMGSWLFGYPFPHVPFPISGIALVGKVPAATALLFDLGVFSLVVGATVLMLVAIAHQSIRPHRVRAAETPQAEERA